MSEALDSQARLAIERACSALTTAYARSVDFRDYDSIVDVFSEDGTLDVGQKLVGRAAIVAAMKKRPGDLRSRHVITNVFIDVQDAHTARGICYLTLYRHQGPESLERGPIAFTGPAAVGHYEDVFVRTAGGWRIRHRTLHLAFRNAAHFAG